jgi:hypothetical protein
VIVEEHAAERRFRAMLEQHASLIRTKTCGDLRALRLGGRARVKLAHDDPRQVGRWGAVNPDCRVGLVGIKFCANRCSLRRRSSAQTRTACRCRLDAGYCNRIWAEGFNANQPVSGAFPVGLSVGSVVESETSQVRCE